MMRDDLRSLELKTQIVKNHRVEEEGKGVSITLHP